MKGKFHAGACLSAKSAIFTQKGLIDHWRRNTFFFMFSFLVGGQILPFSAFPIHHLTFVFISSFTSRQHLTIPQSSPPAMSDENLVKETLALMASSTSREGVQAIRLASQNKTVDIATHKDTTTGQEVVLWSDIIMVFRDALYLQYGTKAIPFLKGPELKV